MCLCKSRAIPNKTLVQLLFGSLRKEGKIAYYALDDEHIAHLFDEGFRLLEELL